MYSSITYVVVSAFLGILIDKYSTNVKVLKLIQAVGSAPTVPRMRKQNTAETRRAALLQGMLPASAQPEPTRWGWPAWLR